MVVCAIHLALFPTGDCVGTVSDLIISVNTVFSYGSYGGQTNQGYGQSPPQSYSQQGYGGYNQNSDVNSAAYSQGGYGSNSGQSQSGR